MKGAKTQGTTPIGGGPSPAWDDWYRSDPRRSEPQMDDDQLVTCIFDAVESYPDSANFNLADRQHFEAMVAHVCKTVDLSPGSEVRAMTAMAVLGPGSPIAKDVCQPRNIPPLTLRQRLLQVIRQHPPLRDGKPREFELAVALGAGRWPDATLTGRWAPVWQGSIRALDRWLKNRVVGLLLWLGDIVVGGEDVFSRGQARELAPTAAWMLARRLCHPVTSLEFVNGEMALTATQSGVLIGGSHPPDEVGNPVEFASKMIPAGARYVFRVNHDLVLQLDSKNSTVLAATDGTRVVVAANDDRCQITAYGKNKIEMDVRLDRQVRFAGCRRIEVWACTCGNHRCSGEHRLSGWDPDDVSLGSFVVSAVQGRPQKGSLRPATGGFVQGMLYPILTMGLASGRVRQVPAFNKICPHCPSKTGTYEGEHCLSCGGAFERDRVHCKSLRRLVLVGTMTPHYELRPENWCKCPRCQNLFEITEEDCRAIIFCPKCEKRCKQQNFQADFRLARCIKEKLQKRLICQACGEKMERRAWCPCCRAEGVGQDCLPQRDGAVWLRQFGFGHPTEGLEQCSAGGAHDKDDPDDQFEEGRHTDD